ncbi:MAG: hypothetical protein JRJ49_03910 [Deltaproteobacteria bacterium]|nr:hypothetical protein [Deltaproteobacteria bacterium]
MEEAHLSVQFNIPVDSEHPYFVDFSDVRGDFAEKRIYKAFNVKLPDFTYNNKMHSLNKTLLFLGGMRGSGKTSEIAKYVLKLDKPDCFFCVVCNIDKELDINNVEYMDILILQIEKLLEKAKDKGLKLKPNIIKDMQSWFGERIVEIDKRLTKEGGFEVGSGNLLSLIVGIRGGITGSKTTASQIRQVLQNNFMDFASKFNEFIEITNDQIRKLNLGREILFVVDGIEKTMTAETRRKVIMKESHRISGIKANTIFTLPIELMTEIQQLIMFAEVEIFPFVKIKHQDGKPVDEAINKFKEFIYKRIDTKLFDNAKTVEKAIEYSGGSPRELLRILKTAYSYAEDIIRLDNINSAIKKLAAYYSNNISSEDLKLLKRLKKNNRNNKHIPYEPRLNKLMENLIVMEYNDGTYKRVNPIVEASEIYKEYVG